MSSTHDEERHAEAYQLLIRLMETPDIDNIKILKALIYPKEDQLPLFDGSTKRRVSIDVLRRRMNVLLFISDLDPSHYERFILEQVYQEAKQYPSKTESIDNIVWLPIVELSVPWDETKQKQFETLQQQMPWYSVYHPSLLDPAAIKYIKDHWHFIKRPLLIVIDSQGKVVNHNAIHMICIWGSHAFPFTSRREEALWKEETWGINLIIDDIEPLILNWIAENKYICFYGGEDIEWIRRFTSTTRAVARAAQIPLEMMYVGKSNPGEKFQRVNVIIKEEKLSHILQDIMVWLFWFRIESMWHSKVQQRSSVDNDPIMEEIMKMLSFDGSDQGWSMISRGSAIVSGKGETISQALTNFEVWKTTVEEKGFVNAMIDYLCVFHTNLYNESLMLLDHTHKGEIPDRIVCLECGKDLTAIFMEKSDMYLCCTD